MRSSSVCPAAKPRAVCVLMLMSSPLDLDAPGERYSGRAFHPNVFAGSLPCDLEFATGQFHFHRGIESAMPSAYRDSGACAGAASQRFAHATLEDAQPYVGFVDDLHE